MFYGFMCYIISNHKLDYIKKLNFQINNYYYTFSESNKLKH